MRKYLLGTLLLTTMPALAVMPYDTTPAERAMCEARGMPGGQGQYQGHFCDGLRFTNRAYASMRNKSDMKYYLEVAIDNFNYVIGHTKESDPKRGEVHLEKGRALKLMGKKVEAIDEFYKAINYNLNTPDVYQALVEHYEETGNNKKALELATEGLTRHPTSKGLKRRFIKLGGIEPLPTPEPTIKSPLIPDSIGKTDVAPPSQDVLKPTLPAPPPVTQIVTPQDSSANNPWCRFCPEPPQKQNPE
jgi:hypothetical protein